MDQPPSGKGRERPAKTAKSLQLDRLVHNKSNCAAWWAQGGCMLIFRLSENKSKLNEMLLNAVHPYMQHPLTCAQVWSSAVALSPLRAVAGTATCREHAAARGQRKGCCRDREESNHVKTFKLHPTRLLSSRRHMMLNYPVNDYISKTIRVCRLRKHGRLRALKKKPGWIVASRVINVEGRR